LVRILSDLDFADDVAHLAELLKFLIPAFKMITSDATPFGLEVNWQKTFKSKLWSAGRMSH